MLISIDITAEQAAWIAQGMMALDPGNGPGRIPAMRKIVELSDAWDAAVKAAQAPKPKAAGQGEQP